MGGEKADERLARAIAAFPFERIEATGEEALATWTELRRSRNGYPVVLGDDASLIALSGFELPAHFGSPRDILAVAESMKHPQDLVAALARGGEQAAASHQKQGLPPLEEVAPDIGEWPDEPDPCPGLGLAWHPDGLVPKVHIAIIPTGDGTAVPAFLRVPVGNGCPEPAYHVAALRSWRDRFGAELVGLSWNAMTVRVSRRPSTQEDAMALAYEQYGYCNEAIGEGYTVSRLAASLMANDWWYFWWD